MRQRRFCLNCNSTHRSHSSLPKQLCIYRMQSYDQPNPSMGRSKLITEPNRVTRLDPHPKRANNSSRSITICYWDQYQHDPPTGFVNSRPNTKSSPLPHNRRSIKRRRPQSAQVSANGRRKSTAVKPSSNVKSNYFTMTTSAKAP
jgi:hypothetical protein